MIWIPIPSMRNPYNLSYGTLSNQVQDIEKGLSKNIDITKSHIDITARDMKPS